MSPAAVRSRVSRFFGATPGPGQTLVKWSSVVNPKTFSRTITQSSPSDPGSRKFHQNCTFCASALSARLTREVHGSPHGSPRKKLPFFRGPHRFTCPAGGGPCFEPIRDNARQSEATRTNAPQPVGQGTLAAPPQIRSPSAPIRGLNFTCRSTLPAPAWYFTPVPPGSFIADIYI
jgi:hypothetical protein